MSSPNILDIQTWLVYQKISIECAGCLFIMEQKDEEINEFDLERAIKSILIKKNEFNKIRAEVRSTIIKIFQENCEDSSREEEKVENESDSKLKPQTILNKLILQYFSWFGYKYSADVFSVETGINQIDVDCSDVVTQINLTKIDGDTQEKNDKIIDDDDDDKDLPILLKLIVKMMINE